jgi:uncharacterized protein
LEKKHGKVFKFTITTNGLAMDDETIEYFNKEMENVVVSLDGRPEVHDKMRPTANNKGSFDLMYPNALKLAKSRAGKSYYIRGTFTAYNPDFAKDVLFLADAGFDQVSIEPVVAPKDVEYSIKEDMVPALKDEYDVLMKEYYQRRRDGRWFNFFHFYVDLSGGPCLPKRLVGCGAGNEYVAITPKGDIYPCHQFVGDDKMHMGNVHTGEFKTELQTEFKKNNVVSKEECSKCWAKYYCSGGCAANAYHENGSIDKPYKIGCELEKKRLECAIALYIKERD